MEDSNISQTKLSTVFFELRDELLRQHQEEKTEVPYVEVQSLKDEAIPKEEISTDLLVEDADIFRKLNIPWMPSEMHRSLRILLNFSCFGLLK